jgi:hypothetical protein
MGILCAVNTKYNIILYHVYVCDSYSKIFHHSKNCRKKKIVMFFNNFKIKHESGLNLNILCDSRMIRVKQFYHVIFHRKIIHHKISTKPKIASQKKFLKRKFNILTMSF